MKSPKTYLVVFRREQNDIPVLLTQNREEAYEYAEDFAPPEAKREEKIIGACSQSSRPVGIAVYRFRKGKLLGYEYVRTFD